MRWWDRNPLLIRSNGYRTLVRPRTLTDSGEFVVTAILYGLVLGSVASYWLVG
jgi:hypothetical protein